MGKNDVNPGSSKGHKSGIAVHSPAVGLNDNMDFMGRRMHVQTEYAELPATRIITQVFCNGRVLLSKKSECPASICESHDFNKLQQLMNAQHRQVIQEIIDKQARILSSH